jgi:hypothetical protein
MLTLLGASVALAGSAIAASSALMANGGRGKGRGRGDNMRITRSKAHPVHSRIASPPAKRSRTSAAATEANYKAKVEALERELADLRREREDVTGASTFFLGTSPLDYEGTARGKRPHPNFRTCGIHRLQQASQIRDITLTLLQQIGCLPIMCSQTCYSAICNKQHLCAEQSRWPRCRLGTMSNDYIV